MPTRRTCLLFDWLEIVLIKVGLEAELTLRQPRYFEAVPQLTTLFIGA